jgi:hypothetical protein
MTPTVLASGALATGSFVLPWVGLREYDTGWIVPYGLWLSLAWAGLIVFGVARHGRRGTWLLIEASLALYWPVRLVVAIAARYHGIS